MVTLMQTAEMILREYQNSPKGGDATDEKMSLIQTAIMLIRNDIKPMMPFKEIYSRHADVDNLGVPTMISWVICWVILDHQRLA